MSIWERDGVAFVPTAHAVGPWDPGQLHGGAPAALLARELAALAPELQVSRLTFEFTGPVPLAPVLVAAQVVKPGKRVVQAEAELSAPDGRVLLRARAVLLRRGALELPERPAEAPAADGPGTLEPLLFGPGEGFHLTAMEIRDAGGTWAGEGRARTWFRLRHELVAGEGPAPGVERAVAAADFSNGVSFAVPFEGWLFVNTDLTVHLHREPAGEWVLLDATTRLEAAGAGLAWSVLHDEQGPFGLAAQTLYVDRR